ncbi:hypothetical protein RRG08_056210 [Elysia crispata]|uniref:Uncharacterized protein n=1 Tax=Elysia crispata TaxID=231223 RepID=A0AAE0YKM7_9GAST|nr:hypothetical protein RRG08_056210 [Elysia crispata]
MSRSGPVTVTAVRTSGNITVRQHPIITKVVGPASPPPASSSSSPCPSFVHSRVTMYHASKIDLRYCRSLHSCGACRLGHADAFPCGAVHYGICAPVTPAPAKQQQQQVVLRRTVSSPSAPTGSMSQPPSPTSRYLGDRAASASPALTRYSSSVHYNTSPTPTANTPRGRHSPQHVESGPPSPRRSLSAPPSRSLTILREGHELAGSPYDTRGAATAAASGGFLVPTSPMSPSGGGGQFHFPHQGQHPGLLRLHPQGRQQLVINSQNLRGLAAMGDVYPANIIDTGRGGGAVTGGGGVAITIQQHGGRTNITSSGLGGTSPDIKIEGEGHEIVIQGGGRQNIRVSQPWSGGRSGPVIRIQGQGQQGHVQYRPGVGVVVASPPDSPSLGTVTSPTPYIVTSPPPTPPTTYPQPALFEYPDTPLPPQQSFPPAPKSFSSTTQIVPKKPTARVAPAPSVSSSTSPQITSQTPATPPATIPAPPTSAPSPEPVGVVSPPASASLEAPSSSESPVPSCSPTPIPTPPFPILSPVESASPSPSPPPLSSAPSPTEDIISPAPVKVQYSPYVEKSLTSDLHL